MRKRRYKYHIDHESEHLQIKQNSDFNLPNYLYKYYSLNEKNVGAVISRKIYVSSPHQLNDLFDSLFLRINYNVSKKEEYKFFVEAVGLEFDNHQFENSEEYRKKLRNTFFAVWNSVTGIISTTDNSLNDLMWAHYTNNEGFVIELDYKKFPKNFGSPVPISYLHNNEFSEKNNYNLLEELFNNTLSKKHIWHYENEYRLIVSSKTHSHFLTDGPFSNVEYQEYEKDNRLQEYPAECVNKIILGFNFFKPLIIGYDKYDFNKPEGLIRKALIDWSMKNNIELEIIIIDHSQMQLKSSKFQLIMKNELEFELKF